jgi:hypothetical protein
MKGNDSNIAMMDFTRLIDAKQMAMHLMEEGVQFAFCPEPLQISYPLSARDQQLEDQSAG